MYKKHKKMFAKKYYLRLQFNIVIVQWHNATQPMMPLNRDRHEVTSTMSTLELLENMFA